MKYNLTIRIILFFILVLILPVSGAYSKEKPNTSVSDKVTFIYIHGVYELNPSEFEVEIKRLHKYFANKYLGNLIISPDYKGVYWGQLPREDKSSALFEDGLLRINSSHNKSVNKKTLSPNIFLLINPLNNLSIFRDNGSSAESVYLRNIINNYMYDFNWVMSDNSHINKIFDLIQKKIDETDGKFVFVCHSLGSVIALNFIMNRIISDPGSPYYKKSNYDNFAGLITSGDISNNFNSFIWAKQVTPEDFASNKNNFIRYFVEKGKFWISYNHQNDILATSLARNITSYNDKGPGFIISKVNKTFFSYKLAYFCKFWDSSDEIENAHEWMFIRPKQFASLILSSYSKALYRKQHGYENLTKGKNTHHNTLQALIYD